MKRPFYWIDHTEDEVERQNLIRQYILAWLTLRAFMEEKRSVPLFHPRQTFFRENRFFHITRFPASKLTFPYVRRTSLTR